MRWPCVHQSCPGHFVNPHKERQCSSQSLDSCPPSWLRPWLSPGWEESLGLQKYTQGLTGKWSPNLWENGLALWQIHPLLWRNDLRCPLPWQGEWGIPPSSIPHPPSLSSQTLKRRWKCLHSPKGHLWFPSPLSAPAGWEELSATSHYVNDFGSFAKSEWGKLPWS